jgi:hypothetical protein
MKQPAARPRATPKPWELLPHQLTPSGVYAIQALAQGMADANQQQLAWTFIREVLCACETMSFWPGAEDGRRASDFAEGKRWIAAQLRRISRLKPATVDSRGAPPAMPGEPQED